MTTHSATTATLKYLTTPENGDKPYQKISVHPETGPYLEENMGRNPQKLTIQNLRGREDTVTLDTAGFQYYVHPSKVATFDNEDEVKNEYYPECAEFIKKATGASRVHLFDHYLRREGQYAGHAHVDQSAAGAIARVKRLFPGDEGLRLLSKRVQIINLWRPISHPAFSWPLALCDYRSIDPEKDVYGVAFINPISGYDGETYGVRFNEKQEWKYVSGLRTDEVVLLKCYDSKPGVAAFTPHTAFEDPLTPAGSPSRASIEVRALVFHDD